MALPNSQKITSEIAMMPDMALKQMAMMHKNDPYVLPFIVSEDTRRKEMRRAAQTRMAGMAQPKVNEAAVANVGPTPNVDVMGNMTGYAQGGTVLPENHGIGALNAPNLQHMADGGIAGYADGGPSQPGMFNYAQMAPAVDLHPDIGVTPRSMAAGGVAHFAEGSKDAIKGDYSPAFMQSFYKTLGFEGGETTDSGGKTKYGISQKAYPNLDISKLTKDDAARLYKKDYWDKIQGDRLAKLDPDLADVMLDTAVNHGANFANRAFASSNGNPFDILTKRKEHYQSLVENNPKKYGAFEKGWNNRLTNLAASLTGSGSAQAGEFQSKDAGLASLQNKEKMPSLEGTTGSGLGQSLIPSAMIPAAREAFSASRVPGLIRGAGVATAVPVIGGMLTDKAMQDLQSLPANRRKEMVNNPMLSAMSGDVGIASAIADAPANNPEGPSKMPYMEQMKNALSQIPRVITSAPGGRKGTSLGFNEETARNLMRPLDQPLVEPGTEAPAAAEDRRITRDDDMSPEGEIKQGIPEKAKDAFMEAAKTELTPKKAKGLTDDDLLAIGLGLMASKNPNLFGAAGESGLGALAMKREQQKTEREDTYRQALAREANAKAANLESGGANTAQAMHQADVMYDSWYKSLNKMDAMSLTPEMQRAKQDEFLQRAFQAFRMAPPAGIGSGTALAGAQSDPLGLRKS